MAIDEIINFEYSLDHSSYLMKNRTNKILIIAAILLILISMLVIYFYPKVKILISALSNSGNYLSLNNALKQIDEEFIKTYNPQSQSRLDVLHYNISINLIPEEKKIIGDVKISMVGSNMNLKNIELNFYDNLDINKLLLNGKEANYSRTETSLIIENNSISTDTFFVNLNYEGEPKNLGFGSFNFDEKGDYYMIYTLNEPVFASTWFPCVDLPDDKALVDIYITNDSSYTSISNGKLMSIKKSGDKKTYHWKTLYPISTYLVSINSAVYKSYSEKYISINKDTLDLSYYATPEKFDNLLKDCSNHQNYLKIFEELFGEYPFIDEKYSVAEFGWKIGAMENQTITGIGSNFISGMRLFQDMIIHELAHSWWGNAVGLKTWKDIWLNEGFATYSVALYWEKESGFDALQTTMIPRKGNFSNGTLYNPANQLFSNLVYSKGAWVLHMLRKDIGDENFFNLMRNYYQTYKYKNASTNDFKKVCEKLANKNMDYFFDQWIYKGEGIVEAVYQWEVKESEGRFVTDLIINQVQNGYDIYKFPIDVKLVYNSEGKFDIKTFFVDNKNQNFKISTKDKPIEILLDPENWLLANFELNNKD